MRSYFLQDIELLIARLKKADLGYGLRYVLAALRGPDDECEVCKSLTTAPIRKFILQEEAYKEAGYLPLWEKVGSLPIDWGLRITQDHGHQENSHFAEHTRLAIGIFHELMEREAGSWAPREERRRQSPKRT